MKNFDDARKERLNRERQFVIGGETFTFRPSVRPEDVLDWFEMRTGESLTGDDGLTQRQQVEVYDRTVLAFLEPSQDEAWAKVRADADPPITIKDISDLIEWLFEEQAGRPTSQPSDSSTGSGSGETGTTSTGSSLSEEEMASTP